MPGNAGCTPQCQRGSERYGTAERASGQCLCGEETGAQASARQRQGRALAVAGIAVFLFGIYLVQPVGPVAKGSKQPVFKLDSTSV